ncbi:protein phosphatase 2C domain-containing protein [Microvirga sp. TS319]|uniref:protein phosphatase 2C domain-containing protein n=1 Tax=Microvirga sp. TS319 TaxID=3241165 RepID=UPI00351A2BD7
MTLTGPEPRFRSLYRQSVPGTRINEDGLGLLGHCAWIIDGATGLSSEQLTDGDSDAAWLAQRIHEALERLAGEGGPWDDLLRQVEAEIRLTFETATAHRSGHHIHHTPSACLGLVRARGSGPGSLRVEGLFLGDVVALVPVEQDVVRWTDERAKPFERKTLAALEAGGHAPGRMSEAVRRQIQDNRTRLNRPDGYWVVNPSRPWAGHELRFEAQVRTGQAIVLATDGFMRLVDVFKAYTDRSLHAALAEGRGDDLIEELRALERDDLLSGAYPRVKTHDDATVLVIAAETRG